MSEVFLAYFLVGAVVIALIAYIWTVVVAFGISTVWGIVALFPPTTIIFLLVHLRKHRGPVSLYLLAAVVAVIPLVLSRVEKSIDLGPYEKTVDGEIHLTLTGWDKEDYSVLKGRADVVVLQMANKDVTNETLTYLEGMEKLRELDLNDTSIDDDGLAILAKLPALESLRLRATKVTDEGFQKHLFDLPNLKDLTLPGPPAIKSATVRKWKAAKSGRRAN